MDKINKIAENNNFFHWYIEFPEVFSNKRGGFDCILTNPPWETLQLKEMEFFTGYNSEILTAPNQSERRKIIRQLKEKDLKIYKKYKNAWKSMKKMSHYLRTSSLFDLSAQGTINTYALFIERCWRLISPNGYTGIICPTGIITNYFMQHLFKEFVKEHAILSLFDFENRKKLFNIHRQFRFCLLSLGGKNISQEIIPITFFILDPKEIQSSLSIIFENKKDLKKRINNLPNDHYLIPLEKEDFELLNPNTLTCPSFRIKKDADLLKHLYKQTEILIKRNVETNEIIYDPWDFNFTRMFDPSNDSNIFIMEKDLEKYDAKPLNEKSNGGIWINEKNIKFMPLYEGKMIWHYNHRYNSVKIVEKGKYKQRSIKNNLIELKNPNFFNIPAYWVEEKEILSRIPKNYNKNWFLAYRDITGATNERTFVAAIIPKTATVSTIPISLSNKSPKELCLLFANLNSIIFDYIVRLKISGSHISLYIMEQLPVFTNLKYSEKLKKIILSKVLELTYTSYDLEHFAKDLCYNKEPFEWNPQRRELIQAELDGIYAILYNIRRNDLIYILNTFDVLKKKEFDEFNEFRTKKLILQAYDKFSRQKELFE
ncbi:MAG: hypothetical protein JXA99_09805 [Candidatus Lokiarchaeota archaeon]|nr:hypothetical protein [Candidatus Lokiarchaeota archaeon]